MKYYIDTEFSERPCTIDLISLAICAEDGRDFYWETYEFDLQACNPWVKANVLPKLTGPVAPRKAIAQYVKAFIGTDTPEFWGYFADYDWVVFCWLFGSMVDLPKGWPMFCRDLKQAMSSLGLEKEDFPPQIKDAHHALSDACWIRRAHSELYYFKERRAKQRSLAPRTREL